jgi:hypothetical protein
MKRKVRGEFDSRISKEDGLMVVKWMDTTSSVQHQHAMELQQLQMFNVTPKTDKKVVQVQRPSMISEYNRYMGGTDLLDQNVSKYRICVRRKK